MTPEALDEIEKLAELKRLRAVLDEAKRRTAIARAERDSARQEVERLREVVRQVHALAEAAVGGTAVGAWLQMQEIHKITKGMVE